MLVLFTDNELEREVLDLLNASELDDEPILVQKATSPANALELLANGNFVLAILGLPVSSAIGDGLNLILQIRQRMPMLPIVVLVNQNALGIGIQALEFGASAFISRLYLSAETLQQIIRNLVTNFNTVKDYDAHGVALVNAMPVGVVLLDEFGVVTAVNEEWHQLTNETTDPLVAEVALGTDFLQLCQRTNRLDVLQLVQQAIAGRSVKQTLEYQWQEAADLSPIWRKITVAPMNWPKGKAVITIQGITDLIRHQIQLEAFEVALTELKTNFSALVHDLRSPLTSFNLYLDLLKAAQPPKKEAYFSILHKEVSHMNQLVDDLLTISRLEMLENFPKTLVDLANLLPEVVKVVQPIIQEKGLELLYVSPSQRPVWVWGQSRQLNRVITNLVNNAIRYTAVGTITIQLQITNNAQNAEIIVSDTGIGIVPEVLPFIFESFFRSPRAQALTPKGTGLGLAIVKRIITLHNGTITVSSEINKGTTFRITLPLATSP